MSSAAPLPASSAVSVSSSVRNSRREPVPREHGAAGAARSPLSLSKRAERLTAMLEVRLLAIDRSRCRNRLLEDEIRQLADAVMLLGGGDELGCRDRALLRMGPAGKRFGADDPARLEVELGLVGDPHLALVDRAVELAEDRQLPRSVLEGLRIVIFPLEAVVRGFLGCDEGAGETIGERAAAADLDPEADRQIDRLAVRRAPGCGTGCRALRCGCRTAAAGPRTRRRYRRRPGRACGRERRREGVKRSDRRAAAPVRGQGSRDFRIIEHSGRDQRLVAAGLVRAKRAEVRQAGDGVDQPALLPADARQGSQQTHDRTRTGPGMTSTNSSMASSAIGATSSVKAVPARMRFGAARGSCCRIASQQASQREQEGRQPAKIRPACRLSAFPRR